MKRDRQRFAVARSHGLRPWRLPLGVLLAAGLVACSGGPKPESAATVPASLPQTAAPAPATAPPPSPPAPTPPPSLTPRRDTTLIVIDDPQAEEDPTSLVEAARRAREERGMAEPSRVVITNENLSELATGQVTMANPESSADGEVAEDSEAPTTGNLREDYWRQGVLDLRRRLRQATDETEELDGQIARLRTRFYAEDDPYVRDGQIKPAWDEALERQRQTREELVATRRELEEFLERGRREGALPGWLREGIELEPEVESAPEEEEETTIGGLSRHRPAEPEVVEKDERDP